jgi:hypothetical protein
VSNPVSLFERLNKEKPKYKDMLPKETEVLQPDPTRDNPTQPNPIHTAISPARNFTKVPNSITKKAIPEKLFKGLSKHTYDILYRQTRGAVNPSRKIQLTKIEIMKKTGLSFNTIQTHIRYLKEAGLLRVEMIIGKHEGSIYEILIPEEIKKITKDNPTQDNPTQPNPTLKTQPDTIQVLGHLGLSNSIENKDTYSSAKTSFKDIENNDDEAFAPMLKVLIDGCEKVAGKNPSKSQKGNWKELAELLVMELEIAAARTKSVSNVPAFLTEHLRRRLLGKAAMLKSKASNSLQVGKANDPKAEEVEEYQAEALSEQGREAVLKTMQEYIGKGQKEFVMSQQDSYTREDWDWLTQELKQENSSKRP